MKTKRIFHPVFFCVAFLFVQFHPIKCHGEKLPVIASIFPVADMVRQVGGEHVDVTLVLPAGASPHTFEPRPSLVKKFSTARIFFMVGAGLEFWADKFVKSSGNHLTRVVLSHGVSLIHSTGHHAEHEPPPEKTGAEGQSAEIANPHIWLDPVIAKSMVKAILTVLCKTDPRHSVYYTLRSDRYLEKLGELDRLIKTTVATFRTKKYVSFHASWDYFARRYGLEPVGVIEASPGRNPTPRQIKNIVVQIEKWGIRAVFAEPQFNPRAAEVIARQADVHVLLLDPVGGPEIKERNTYVDLMKYNLNVLHKAMK
ncbi:MAG: zinc ABC transporter substrate-binding protein [Deltaproteobacteria bacterium]|nr:zinc ABC transporter substrate-binding protein [Deltaproteobacteria bacterium]